jgi:hypothetical protein
MGLGPQISAPGQQYYDPNQNMGNGFQNQMAPQYIQPVAAEMTPMEPMKLEPMKLGAVEFTGGAKEFIPKGKMVATKDQFPDLDALGDDVPKSSKGGKKGKGKKTGIVKVEA